MKINKNIISDETESVNLNNDNEISNEEIKIKTIIVTEDMEEKSDDNRFKTIIKVAAGVGMLVATGLLTKYMNSRKRK